MFVTCLRTRKTLRANRPHRPQPVFLCSANTMGAPLQSFYPPSLYGVPTSVYPYQQPGAFPGGPYGGGGTGGGGAAGTAGAGGSTAAGNFYGEGVRATYLPIRENECMHPCCSMSSPLLPSEAPSTSVAAKGFCLCGGRWKRDDGRVCMYRALQSGTHKSIYIPSCKKPVKNGCGI